MPATVSGLTYAGSINAVTTLNFDSPVSFAGSMVISDLEGTVVSKLLDGSAHRTGSYAVSWIVPDGTPNGVYRCVFVGKDSSGQRTLFADSILIALEQGDPQTSVVGWTGANGEFETRDRLLVPGILGLPPIPMTTAEGHDPVGTFMYSDTVAVTLTDTSTQQSMTVRRSVADQPNTISVIWNPGAPGAPPFGSRDRLSRIGSSLRDSIIETTPTAWKLYQNYPNPFN